MIRVYPERANQCQRRIELREWPELAAARRGFQWDWWLECAGESPADPGAG